VLESGWITTGAEAFAFEDEFRNFVGAKEAIAVNSCTAALHLALEALGIGAADEVVVPTMTFAATAEVVRYFGAKPVLVDCLAADHQLDVIAVEHAITSRTKAVIPVHFAGQACDMGSLLELTHARGLRVVEDAAHSLPARVGDNHVGTLGDIGCFSFYATKTMTTAEGGMAVTADAELADRMRVMRLHGISKDAWKRYSGEGKWFYEIVAPGYKYNLTDVAAAMGRVQLRRLEAMTARRQAVARAYREAFAQLGTLELLEIHEDRSHCQHLFVVKIVEERLSVGRDQLLSELEAKGVGCSVHFIPLHLHPYYRDTLGHRPEDFPTATDCYRRSISLPIGSAMSEAQVGHVIDAVASILARYAR
jgi:perosamine synthetase